MLVTLQSTVDVDVDVSLTAGRRSRSADLLGLCSRSWQSAYGRTTGSARPSCPSDPCKPPRCEHTVL